MKLLTFISALAISALTLFGCSSTQSVVDHTRASILRITSQVDEGKAVCTGFVVKPQIVLTAAHCVGVLMQADGYEAKLIDKDDFYDLAALEVKLTRKTPLDLRDEPVIEGEKLIGIGYAWGWTFPLAQHVTVLIPAYRPSRRYAIGIITQGGYYHGMSGGPVIDLSGRVVGTMQITNDGSGYGVGTLIIKTFLVTAGVN